MTDAKTIIKANISPSQAIEHYTHQIPRHGRYICPFHQDIHPSLTVKGQHWRCWSCGEAGDVISFVMKLFDLSFTEAMNKLAKDFDLDISSEERPDLDPYERLCNKIVRACDEDNRKQLSGYRQMISEEINILTICHRVLMQHGAPKEILDAYCREIDELIEEEDRAVRMCGFIPDDTEGSHEKKA